MKIKKFMLFFEEPSEGNTGGGTSSGGTGTEGAGGGTPPPPATPPGFDYDKFASSMSGSMVEGLKPLLQQNQQKQPPTPEQIAEAKRAFNHFEITDEYLKEFGNVETQKSALEKFRDGIVQYVLSISAAQDLGRWTEREKALVNRMTPLEQFYQQQAAQHAHSTFTQQYPKLADAKYKDLLEMVGNELQAKGLFKGNNPTENFKTLATHAAEVIKRFDPQFTLEGSSSNTNNGQSGNGLDSTSTGSGGGGGSTVKGKQPGNTLLAGLGPVRR